MAFVAVAAVFTAAEVTGTMILAAMAEVGTAMSVVGAVTGNKSLLKLGAVVGLVGGVGGMIAGAGGAAGAAAAGEIGVDTAADIASKGLLDVGSQSVSSAVNAGTVAGVDLPPLSGAMETGQGIVTGDPMNDFLAAPKTAATEQTTQTAAQTAQVAGPVEKTAVKGPAAKTGPSAPPGPSTKGSDFFSNVGKFIGDPANKEIVNQGVKVLGGALQGMQSADQFDQKMKLEKDQFAYAQALRNNVTQGQLQSRSGILATANP